ncbi:MAG: translation initiation factor IF-2 [candidate division WOR-3 bacterium]|nr:translation initiation factor IF-2 [candidate division WOR-3 bacterium]MCX7947024.1 translation initiation factor IF-2 [candidate division WOR-3 bacterium]MDW8149935.1 translation initiation factor IF-2 [candidate division WOR-3 bacterium]
MNKKGPVQLKELAKDLGISVKTAVELLKDAGYEVKSGFSKVNKEMEDYLRKILEKEKQEVQKDIEKKKEIYQKLEVPRKKVPRRLQQRQEKREEITKEERPIKKHVKQKLKPKKLIKEEQVLERKIIEIPGPLTVGEFSTIAGLSPSEVIKTLMDIGYIATINQTLPFDVIELLAENFGFQVVRKEIIEEKVKEEVEYDYIRPPIVTIMGHVDHGKTTLLDKIRNTNIAEKEEGRITQRIGAYQVVYNNKKITFIDTPGHEAFTAMRARGAQITDIVILVVDGREGVKEQTIEALNHAKAAGVKIIVAITKIDLPDANIDMVKRQLSEYNLIPDDWGGSTIFVPVSAYKGIGINDLLEAILIVSEELDLKTSIKGTAKGIVLESKMDKGKGPVATLIVQRGVLKSGDIVVAGYTYAKIRAIYNDRGEKLSNAYPSDPVLVQGFEELPRAGDKFEIVEDINEARKIVEERRKALKAQLARGEMESIASKIKEKILLGEKKELAIVLKADNYGTLEAIKDSVLKMEFEKIKPIIVHSGIGDITESDVMLAEASEGVVLGFSVKIDSRAKSYADAKKVPIKVHKIIYHLLEDLTKFMQGILEPEYKEELLGKLEIKAVFKTKYGKVAGCYALEGKVLKSADKVRLLRDGNAVYEGKIESLRHFQTDVEEVSAGMECGIRLTNWNDYKEGDIIEVYKVVKILPKLE